MHVVTLCLVLIGLACSASLLARFIKLPLPFLQIATGIVAALPPFSVNFPLDPQVFLLLFIPLLLFGDGWRLPQRELRAERWPVLGLAVGLVIFTVAVAGYALHWLIPSMPLSVAFAVAAVVSPTDAVAVSAFTARVHVPHRMKYLLESEALLNDATGLVAMRFAIAATLSGSFYLVGAGGTFLFVALGGLAIGIVLTLAYGQLHRRLLSRASDATLQTVLAGLLPFGAFAIAEEVGASGILAAVAAGMTASRLSILENAHFSARIQTRITWDVVSFCLNGTIFVLLGLQLPSIFGAGPEGIDLMTNASRFSVIGEILLLTLLLVVLRCVWVVASIALGRVLRRRDKFEQWRIIAASSVSGVRGAVTLAGVLSFPLALPDGLPFPSRDLAITLATGVILSSMLIAAAGLPLLLKRVDTHEDKARGAAKAARIAAAEAALRTLSTSKAASQDQGSALASLYRETIISLTGTQVSEDDSAWREMHREALHAERDAVQALRRNGQIDDMAARQLLGELDVVEAALAYRSFRTPCLENGAQA